MEHLGAHSFTRTVVVLWVNRCHYDLICFGSDSLLKRPLTDEDKLAIWAVVEVYLAHRAEALQQDDPASVELLADRGYLADRALQCMRLQEYKEAMMRQVDAEDQQEESKLEPAESSANSRPPGTHTFRPPSTFDHVLCFSVLSYLVAVLLSSFWGGGEAQETPGGTAVR